MSLLGRARRWAGFPEQVEDRRRRALVESQDVGVADDVGRDGAIERIRLEVVGVERSEAPAEVEQVAGGQLLVDRDAAEADVDEAVERAGVARAPLAGPAERLADERLLATDAPDVGESEVDLPLAVDQLLVGAGADEGQRLHGVEGDAAGAADVEAGLPVAGGIGEVDGHAVDRLDQFPERGEVDLHVVVDVDAEVLVDRADEQQARRRSPRPR